MSERDAIQEDVADDFRASVKELWLVARGLPPDILPPKISCASDGEIFLEWKIGDQVLSMSVIGDGTDMLYGHTRSNPRVQNDQNWKQFSVPLENINGELIDLIPRKPPGDKP